MNAIENSAISNLMLQSTQAASGQRNQLGQNEFLELMLAQVRSQDPFQPMENGEFIAQLAQFSTVTGISEMNSSLSGLTSSLYSNQALQAASLVGHEVLYANNTLKLEESGTVKGAYELPASAGNVTMNIFDASGNLVRKVQLGPQSAGQHDFEWDGVNNEGTRAAAGEYRVSIEYSSGDFSSAADMLVSATVTSVNIGANGGRITLSTSNGQSLDFSDVRQIQ
jgi:flagellar basal-body rod modification protein FlgD